MPFNDLIAVERELVKGDFAAIITEPALNNCGMVLPNAGFIQGLRRLCSQYGSLLILDETHTLSNAHGGWAKANDVTPDFLVIGKPIAGGQPAAAYGFNNEMAKRMQAAKDSSPLGHSGICTTLDDNMMTIAAIHTTLTEVATKAAYKKYASFSRNSRIKADWRHKIKTITVEYHPIRCKARIAI